MNRIVSLHVFLIAALALVACGETQFGGGPTRRDSRFGNERGPDDPSLDQTQADGEDGGGGDAGSMDAGDGVDREDAGEGDGSDGPGSGGADGGDTDGTDVPETASLYWHWPCARRPATPAPTDANAMVITGGGDFMLENGALTLEVGGEACDPGEGPRDVLFVVDVSDSMRNFLNLGNDPVKNDTCGRNEGVKAVLDSLGDEARVALVTFDGNPQTITDGYLTVAAFRAEFAKRDVLCKSGANTNFKKAFAAAQGVLTKARKDSAKELYFLSDGEPNSSDVDGREEAEAIKQTATIATLMLKGDEDFMRDVLASRDANDQPLHDKVEAAAELAAALAALAVVELKDATIRYGQVGDEANWQEKALDLPADLTFALPPWTLTPQAWPDGFGFAWETVNSRGVTENGSGRLLWKP